MVFRVAGQVNTDSIFNSAIINARQGNYDEALEEAGSVLKIYPDRTDILVFVANVYAWKGDYASALNQVEQAYQLNDSSSGLYNTWLNILLWSKDYENVIKIANQAKQNSYTDDYNLVLKKSLAYKALERYDNGIELIDSYDNFLDSSAIKNLYNEMLLLNKKKAVSFYYSLSLYDDNDIQPQHLAYVDYSFKVKRQTFIPRLNYAYRFDQSDFQIESDFYQILNNGQYLYANFGVGVLNELFPKYRAGFEYYFPIAKSMEASLGGRYLNSDDYDVVILTGHLSKYFHRVWLSVRPYYVLQETKNTFTYVFNARYYEPNPLNYWGIEFLYGNSPDENFSLLQSSDVYLLKNYRVKIEKNCAVLKFGEIKLTAAYSYEEFQADLFRNKFTLEVLLKHRF
jgi:YaiO family outer membrane protein